MKPSVLILSSEIGRIIIKYQDERLGQSAGELARIIQNSLELNFHLSLQSRAR